MSNSSLPARHRTFPWTILSALVASVGVAGSLWLSMAMSLKACPLCLYQRAFIMSAAAVLLIGLLTDLRHSAGLPLLAIAAVVAGLGVSGFHVYLEQNQTLECPRGVFGLGTAPQQSLAVFVLLLVTLLIASWSGAPARQFLPLSAAVLLGMVMSAGTIFSAPPLPKAPNKPYAEPLEMCRPPYRAGSAGDAQWG